MSLNKKTLSEELKRFRLLSEYSFYVPEAYEEMKGNGLLGEDDPTDDEDSLGDAPVDDMGDDSFGDEPAGDENSADDMGGDETNQPLDDAGSEEGPIDMTGDSTSGDEMGAAPVEPAPADDSVELDVTQLVQGTEAAKSSADLANQQISQLLQKIDSMSVQISKMGELNQKLDSLEHEVEKRNPTEQEKLEMRSLNSYPYNLKLTDYWADKEGAYDVMGNEEKRAKEYVLTQDDVNSEFNQTSVKNTFDTESDFEEEDI